MSYQYYEDKDLTKEVLVEDDDFLNDASMFLAEREDIAPEKPEDIYDSYMEHFRFQNTNEVTAIRDMEYAQDADDEQKPRLNRLMETFERMPSDLGLKAAGDYAESIIKAPSTYLGIASGGAGKVATLAATQGIKQGIFSVLRGAAIGATVDGAVAGGTNLVNQETKKEVGLIEETDYTDAALDTVIGAVTGGVGGGLGRAVNIKRAKVGQELVDADLASNAAKIDRGTAAVAELRKTKGKEVDTQVTALKKSLDDLNGKKNPLDPDSVAEGSALKSSRVNNPNSDALGVNLDEGVIQRISAASVAVKDKLNIQGNSRITQTISEGLSDGTIKVKEMEELFDTYGISSDEFSKIYLHELSDAGRKLGYQSNIVKKLQGDISGELAERGLSNISGDIVSTITKSGQITRNSLKTLDKVRLAMMTQQLATVMRNTVNGGMRAVTSTIDNVATDLLNGNWKAAGKSAFLITDIADQKVAKSVQEILANNAPDAYKKVFRSMADIDSHVGGKVSGGVMKVARGLNILNTLSDNMFKRGVITNSLKRRLAADGKDLLQILREGKFDTIDKKLVQDSIEDAMYFTYQSSPKGKNAFSKVAKGAINAVNDYPFLVSSVMPFPRFVANQIQFITEHAPIIGMLPLDKLGAKVGEAPFQFRERLAKQITGVGMLTSAYLYARAHNGEGRKWYEYSDSTGGIVDARAMLGPFAAFALAGDMLARSERFGEGGVEDGQYSQQARGRTLNRDIVQTMIGSTARAGTGLFVVDELWDAFSGDNDIGDDKWKNISARFVADVLSTFTIPLNQVQDIQSQFNPKMRNMKETRDVNWFDMAYNRLTRSIRYDESLPDKESSTRSATPRKKLPLLKQMFGLTYREDKNMLERELDRLQIEPREFSKWSGDQRYDMLHAEELGRQVEKSTMQYLNSPAYKELKTRIYRTDTENLMLDQKAKTIDGSQRRGLIKNIQDIAVKEADKFAENTYGKEKAQFKRFDAGVQQEVFKLYPQANKGVSLADAIKASPRKAYATALDMAKRIRNTSGK